jgi:hypothetical protein
MRERYREKGRKEEERKCLLGQKYVFYYDNIRERKQIRYE